MWFENNPEITHGEIAWVLQKNKDDGMQHDNDQKVTIIKGYQHIQW